MLEAAVIVARLMQYAGAAVLFGSSLFFVYALPPSGPDSARERRGARPLVVAAAVLLALGSLLGLGAQASVLAGSIVDGLTGGAIGAMVAYMALGKAAVVRAAAGVLALLALVALQPGRMSWLAVAGLGLVGTASLAWMGHGAASEGTAGWLHLSANVLHVVAAALWMGALAGFALLLLDRAGDRARRDALHGALVRFSGFGPALVAVLVLTGLVNGWFLVGPAHLAELWLTPYGRLLTLKLVLFAAMLALAAVNRLRITPQLQRGAEGSLRSLKRSIGAETAAGFAILALVAWLGTLAPLAQA